MSTLEPARAAPEPAPGPDRVPRGPGGLPRLLRRHLARRHPRGTDPAPGPAGRRLRPRQQHRRQPGGPRAPTATGGCAGARRDQPRGGDPLPEHLRHQQLHRRPRHRPSTTRSTSRSTPAAATSTRTSTSTPSSPPATAPWRPATTSRTPTDVTGDDNQVGDGNVDDEGDGNVDRRRRQRGRQGDDNTTALRRRRRQHLLHARSTAAHLADGGDAPAATSTTRSHESSRPPTADFADNSDNSVHETYDDNSTYTGDDTATTDSHASPQDGVQHRGR